MTPSVCSGTDETHCGDSQKSFSPNPTCRGMKRIELKTKDREDERSGVKIWRGWGRGLMNGEGVWINKDAYKQEKKAYPGMISCD